MTNILDFAPEQKRVSITSKRQFTIPQKFFKQLGFGTEAICTLGEGMLIIQPASPDNNGEFSEQILAELIDEGYSGKELLEEFKIRQAKIRPAVESLIEQAKLVAQGGGDYSSYNDVFNEE